MRKNGMNDHVITFRVGLHRRRSRGRGDKSPQNLEWGH